MKSFNYLKEPLLRRQESFGLAFLARAGATFASSSLGSSDPINVPYSSIGITRDLTLAA